ncbi:UDP-N-acetylglucosamine 2-epimerase (hydrolyzing) [bacterium]|nr:UDP-N-acetylglucosamine 2-epimerase (hydrolyzing) [bacterium]
MKKVLVVTGGRADWTPLLSVVRAIDRAENLSLSLIATGLHLLGDFGLTLTQIKEEFSFVEEVSFYKSHAPIFSSFSKGVSSLGDAFCRIKPDLILILGDRIEAFAAAISAFLLQIPLGHIHGGERTVSGHMDESMRHSISRMAAIHFVATEGSKERLFRMGEEEWRIHRVGAPALDLILSTFEIPEDRLFSETELKRNKDFLVFCYHPVSVEKEKSYEQTKETLSAIKELGIQTIVLFPNNDPGYEGIIKAIDEFSDEFIVRKNLSPSFYFGLLRRASALVGNSSSGIIEAPSFGLPCVNIGSRNKDREHCENVVFANCRKDEIQEAIREAISLAFREKAKNCKNSYGDGRTSERIVKILEGIEIDKRLLTKQIRY